jgi:hypothetical protein
MAFPETRSETDHHRLTGFTWLTVRFIVDEQEKKASNGYLSN